MAGRNRSSGQRVELLMHLRDGDFIFLFHFFKTLSSRLPAVIEPFTRHYRAVIETKPAFTEPNRTFDVLFPASCVKNQVSHLP